MNYRFLNLIMIFAALSSPVILNAQKYQGGLVDKSIALIGNDMVQLSMLESEVQYKMLQGAPSTANIRCDVLEDILTQKLFVIQANIDSLTVGETEKEQSLNERIQQVTAQLGGEAAVENYFKKPIYKLKDEWRQLITEQFLIQQMQNNVMSSAPDMRPSDVRDYVRKTPADSLPIVSTKYQYRQIVVYPDKMEPIIAVKDRLLEFRQRILDGERFQTLATLYSQDPGSASRGGELGLAPKSMYWPAFSDAASALKEGQVSQIVETPDGFHLIQMIQNNGDMINVRHILIKPQYTTEDMAKAFNRLDSIKNLIVHDSVNFEAAARRFSGDLKSFINGGLVADEYTGSAYFEKDQLKPTDYNIIQNLQEGDISEPFESTDNEGNSGNTLYKIIRLDKIIPSHVATYEDDFDTLQEEAKNVLAVKAIENFIEQKKKTTYIRIDPLFESCPFIKEGWTK